MQMVTPPPEFEYDNPDKLRFVRYIYRFDWNATNDNYWKRTFYDVFGTPILVCALLSLPA
jgi:hypothetical protein